MTIKLSRLIKYLEHIQNNYGDMEIEGNIIGDDRTNFIGICVEDNYLTGFYNNVDDDRYTLLLEFENYTKDRVCFNAYEYPTMKDINL